MNVLVCDTSTEEQIIETSPRTTAAQPCLASGLLSYKERQASGKFNLNCSFYMERTEANTYFTLWCLAYKQFLVCQQ